MEDIMKVIMRILWVYYGGHHEGYYEDIMDVIPMGDIMRLLCGYYDVIMRILYSL